MWFILFGCQAEAVPEKEQRINLNYKLSYLRKHVGQLEYHEIGAYLNHTIIVSSFSIRDNDLKF